MALTATTTETNYTRYECVGVYALKGIKQLQWNIYSV